MSRYARMFARSASRRAGVLGAFLMLGDPTPEKCADYLEALVAGGADMLELGIPFSDPVADGPVIQASAARALAKGVRTADVLALVADFRKRHPDTPVGILTYANIVAARGIDGFSRLLREAGADSLLVADVPSLEATSYAAAARAHGLDLVMIAAPNTRSEAIARIATLSGGYTYCVARAGVTGHGEGPHLDHRDLFDRLAAAGAPPPILGFGISTPEQVRQALSSGASGVICGSALVQLVADEATPAELTAVVATLKAACHSLEPSAQALG